jgi:hypothetical protein
LRTTLDIDDDLLAAARELARRERHSVGSVISRLLRQSLSAPASAAVPVRRSRAVAGFKPFSARLGVGVTDEEVNALREAEGI